MNAIIFCEGKTDAVLLGYYIDKVIIWTASESRYIYCDRLELKAKLSTVFAVMSPEKVFTFIDEILKTTVKWEEKQCLNDLFKELIKMLNVD